MIMMPDLNNSSKFNVTNFQVNDLFISDGTFFFLKTTFNVI